MKELRMTTATQLPLVLTRNWKMIKRLGLVPLIPLIILAIFLVVGLFGPWLMPEDPGAVNFGRQFIPPAWQAKGSWSTPLGTDHLGRDVLSRLIYGARTALLVATIAILIGLSIGISVGIAAGYIGGALETILMRLVDTLIAIPLVLLALVTAVIFGSSLQNVILVIGFLLWTRVARVVRGETLAIRNYDYIKLAQVAGCSRLRIMRRYVLPNVTNTIIVLATLQVGGVILIESALSFLGAGVPISTPSWGGMISGGRDYVATAWWLAGIPGLAILCVVLSLNLAGDWLADRLDPGRRNL